MSEKKKKVPYILAVPPKQKEAHLNLRRAAVIFCGIAGAMYAIALVVGIATAVPTLNPAPAIFLELVLAVAGLAMIGVNSYGFVRGCHALITDYFKNKKTKQEKEKAAIFSAAWWAHIKTVAKRYFTDKETFKQYSWHMIKVFALIFNAVGTGIFTAYNLDKLFGSHFMFMSVMGGILLFSVSAAFNRQFMFGEKAKEVAEESPMTKSRKRGLYAMGIGIGICSSFVVIASLFTLGLPSGWVGLLVTLIAFPVLITQMCVNADSVYQWVKTRKEISLSAVLNAWKKNPSRELALHLKSFGAAVFMSFTTWMILDMMGISFVPILITSAIIAGLAEMISSYTQFAGLIFESKDNIEVASESGSYSAEHSYDICDALLLHSKSLLLKGARRNSGSDTSATIGGASSKSLSQDVTKESVQVINSAASAP